jgi:hypothetical protein
MLGGFPLCAANIVVAPDCLKFGTCLAQFIDELFEFSTSPSASRVCSEFGHYKSSITFPLKWGQLHTAAGRSGD